jgi:vesicle-fusing ATPase
MRRGEIAFAIPQRKWATLSLDQDVKVSAFQFDPNTQYIGSISLNADFQTKKS